MRDALRATGRPIVYSINPYNGNTCDPTGAHTSTCGLDLLSIANMWRIGADIKATWGDITRLIDIDASLSAYAGAGHWNDPDMLEVGNSGLSDTEGRTHFSMWAILAAPLIAGNNLGSMSATTEATLTNTEVIAVDRDPLDKQGHLAASPGTNLQVWSKTLSGTNVRAVALLNRGTATASITVQWSALGIPTGAATVRDLWSHTDLGSFSGSYTASSNPEPRRRHAQGDQHALVELRHATPSTAMDPVKREAPDRVSCPAFFGRAETWSTRADGGRRRRSRVRKRSARVEVLLSGGLRLRGGRRHRRAEGGVLRLARLQQEPPDLLGDLRVLGDVGAGLVASLADPFAAERDKGARLLEEAGGRRQVDDLTGGVDADAVEDVELGLAKGGGDLVLHHLDPRVVADHLVAVLDQIFRPPQ